MKQIGLFAKKAKRLVAVTVAIVMMLTSGSVVFGAVAEDDWTAGMGACEFDELFSAFSTGAVTQTDVANAVTALNAAIQAFEDARKENNPTTGCTCTFCEECLGITWNRLNRMLFAIDFGATNANISLDLIGAIRQFNSTGGFSPLVPHQNTRNNMEEGDIKNLLTAIMASDGRSLTGQVISSDSSGQAAPANRLNRLMTRVDFGAVNANISLDLIGAIRQFNSTGGFSPLVPHQNTRNNMEEGDIKSLLTAIMRADHRSLTGQVIPVA